jgi:hypothetical protein
MVTELASTRGRSRLFEDRILSRLLTELRSRLETSVLRQEVAAKQATMPHELTRPWWHRGTLVGSYGRVGNLDAFGELRSTHIPLRKRSKPDANWSINTSAVSTPF